MELWSAMSAISDAVSAVATVVAVVIGAIATRKYVTIYPPEAESSAQAHPPTVSGD